MQAGGEEEAELEREPGEENGRDDDRDEDHRASLHDPRTRAGARKGDRGHGDHGHVTTKPKYPLRLPRFMRARAVVPLLVLCALVAAGCLGAKGGSSTFHATGANAMLMPANGPYDGSAVQTV